MPVCSPRSDPGARPLRAERPESGTRPDATPGAELLPDVSSVAIEVALPARRQKRPSRVAAGVRWSLLGIASLLGAMMRRPALVVGSLLIVGGLAATSGVLGQGDAESQPRSVAAATPATTQPAPPPPPPAPPTTDPPAAPAAPAPPPPDWTPTQVRVGKIEVAAPIDALGVDDQDRLQVPTDPSRVGWWSGGAQPGEDDPAVLVGHLDSTTGPAVFHRLELLAPGDVIEVDRADATTARFMVERIESHPKDEFPTMDVYGPTEASTLRLVTCFGEFDEERFSYKDNLIVYANLMS